MTRILDVSILLLALLDGALAAEATAPVPPTGGVASVWGEITQSEAPKPPTISTTTAGKGITVSFSDLTADLHGGAALQRSALASFTVPVKVPRENGLHGFLASLQYGAHVPPGARAVLVTIVGNAIDSFQVPTTPSDPESEGDMDGGGIRMLFSIEPHLSEFQTGKPVVVPDVPVSLLLATSRTADETVLLQVDWINIEAIDYYGGQVEDPGAGGAAAPQ